MDKQRWQRIESLFERAVEMEGAVRDAFLDRECAGDGELLAEVRALIAADTAEHSLLDGSAAAALDVPVEASWSGRIIGNYRVIERIGTGGMGAVFLAERADGHFEQRVALKVIKRGMDSEDILRRFRSERQMLARLDHPNIARLLDGGVTADGVPYFTMEYVEGLPIDRYCDEQALDIERRLGLFEEVCSTVMYAQRNLIVHRDLKPSNIMVTGDGTVKLLDFGIAKFIDEDVAPDSGITRTGLRVMTPGYAAPEQVRGEAVTTATDVYALGVVLYELLTGHRPHRPDAPTPQALERAILETSPERPSALRRVLAGDLDNVCLMALRKEPERRYHSAEQLYDDIRNYRAGRPVIARPDTPGYRVQKFVQRNTAGVVAAVAVFVVVAALVSFYTVQLARERDRARLEAKKAQTVSEYLTSLFEVVDPEHSRGETVTARELLDRGRERLDTELADQPEVRASMTMVIGNVYYGLGLFDEAAELVGQSLDLRRELYGDHDREVIESRNLLGQLTTERGDYEGAEMRLREVLATTRSALGARDTLVAKVANNLAVCLNEQAKYEEAEALYREVIDIWTEHRGEGYRDAAVALNNLALNLHEQERYEESRATFEKALAQQRHVFGDVHPELATTLYNYGQLVRAMGDFEAAERIAREGLVMDRRVFGDEHPNVAYSMNSLAILLRRRGEFGEAEALTRDALDIRHKTLGGEHSNVAHSLSALAQIKHDRGEFSAAESLYVESLEMHKRVQGPEHPTVALRMMHLGWLYYDRGEYERSERIEREALPINAAALGEESSQYATNLFYIARALRGQGRADEALELAQRSLAIEIELRGEDHYLVAMNRQEIARDVADLGDLPGAEREARAALDILGANETGGERRRATAVTLLAEMLRRGGKYEEAESRYRRALEELVQMLPDNHRTIGATLVGLGLTLCEWGDPRAGEPYLRKGTAILARWLPAGHAERLEAESALGRCIPER